MIFVRDPLRGQKEIFQKSNKDPFCSQTSWAAQVQTEKVNLIPILIKDSERRYGGETSQVLCLRRVKRLIRGRPKWEMDRHFSEPIVWEIPQIFGRASQMQAKYTLPSWFLVALQFFASRDQPNWKNPTSVFVNLGFMDPRISLLIY